MISFVLLYHSFFDNILCTEWRHHCVTQILIGIHQYFIVSYVSPTHKNHEAEGRVSDTMELKCWVNQWKPITLSSLPFWEGLIFKGTWQAHLHMLLLDQFPQRLLLSHIQQNLPLERSFWGKWTSEMKLNSNKETHTLVFLFELEKGKSYALIVI